MNREILHTAALLNAEGPVVEPGWAKQLLPVYDNKHIKAKNCALEE